MKTTGAVKKYEERMGHSGLRLTPQRRHVFNALMSKRDHPTATEVFLRVKKSMPGISLATVYNCLETLVANGLVRQVNVDREPTRYCPNTEEHGHFICEQCSQVFDIELAAADKVERAWNLPSGFSVTSHELTMRGICANCSHKN